MPALVNLGGIEPQEADTWDRPTCSPKAGHRLNRFMLVAVIVLYTVWLGGAVGNIFRTMNNMEGLALKARRSERWRDHFLWISRTGDC